MPLIKQISKDNNTLGSSNVMSSKIEDNVSIYGETIYTRSVSKKTIRDIFEDLKAWVTPALLPSLDEKWFMLKLKSINNLLLKGERWNFLLVESPFLIETGQTKYDLPTNFMHHSALWATYKSPDTGKMVKIEFVYEDQAVVFENGKNFYKVNNNGKLELINLDLNVQNYCCKNKNKETDTLWLSYYCKPELPRTMDAQIKWYPEVDEYDEVLRELLTYELYLRAGQRPLSMPDVNRYIQLMQIWDKQGLEVMNKRHSNTQTIDFSNLIEF